MLKNLTRRDMLEGSLFLLALMLFFSGVIWYGFTMTAEMDKSCLRRFGNNSSYYGPTWSAPNRKGTITGYWCKTPNGIQRL